MRVPRPHRPSGFNVAMTSMIDVVFLLLVFFLWTSSFEMPEYDLLGALALPPVGNANSTTDAAPVPFDEIVIRIVENAANFELRLNASVLTDTRELKDRLTAIAALGAQPAVIVHPDPAVPMEIAIRVYDSARAAGFDRVLFTVVE